MDRIPLHEVLIVLYGDWCWQIYKDRQDLRPVKESVRNIGVAVVDMTHAELQDLLNA